MENPVSMNTKVTLSLILCTIPLLVWGARLDADVAQLKVDRAELKQELKEIRIVLEDIRARLPSRIHDPR